jgi:hypothetical protein
MPFSLPASTLSHYRFARDLATFGLLRCGWKARMAVMYPHFNAEPRRHSTWSSKITRNANCATFASSDAASAA